LRFLDRVAELVGRPVEVISVGPDRDQTIFDG
jgi:adenylosuccinate synthase